QLSSDRVAFQNDPKSFYELSHRLYKKLLPESIQARVEKGEILDLTIVPDAVLNVCAFDALLTQKDVKGTVPYLIHKANISYTYSIVSLQYQKQLKNENNKNVLSVIPVFEAQERGLATLEYSTYEKSNMPTLHSQLLLKEQATRRAFLSNFKDFKVLHFSTHAEADSAQIPRIEFIDSTLFLPEIYGLPLQNDLVVLSACQTAIGTENSGEGLMSLARAFAYAGAPSLVASLWKVNNKSTSDLMTAFYRHLNDDHSKSAALRQAKLDYLSEASIAQQSPYYWSGMIFMGADDVVAFERTIPIHFWLLGLGVLLLLGFLVFSLISNSLSKKT
ncbi:MAG: CHAT domain-containing protein, partial [Bacteroidota bacterium]